MSDLFISVFSVKKWIVTENAGAMVPWYTSSKWFNALACEHSTLSQGVYNTNVEQSAKEQKKTGVLKDEGVYVTLQVSVQAV